MQVSLVDFDLTRSQVLVLITMMIMLKQKKI